MHRDLKPENVLIDKELNNALKIIDFGTSCEFDKKAKELLKTTHGTSYYIAPEVLTKKYDERCDVWSIGVILYILLSGKPPFDGDNDDDITDQVKLGKYNLTDGVWPAISKDAKDLIKKLLTYKFTERCTAREALGHEWFKNATSKMADKAVMDECMRNLTAFSATQKLQQATMSMMVQNMISKEETAQLQQVFMQLDLNKDGKLQYNELLQGYEEYYIKSDEYGTDMGKEMAKSEVDRIFEMVDIDHSNEIDFSEFVTATANRNNLLSDDKLKKAFGYYDKDNSGSISVDEIKSVLGVGQRISEEVWATIVKEVDTDGDGEVSLEEFKSMMKQLLK